jgi:hypothetical protein
MKNNMPHRVQNKEAKPVKKQHVLQIGITKAVNEALRADSSIANLQQR